RRHIDATTTGLKSAQYRGRRLVGGLQFSHQLQRGLTMKILVPLDGSTVAEAAVPLALQLACSDNAGLVLLMVTNVHPPPEPAPCDPDVAPIRDAQSYLDTARQHLASTHCNVSTAVWRGAPAAAIIRAAQHYGAERIVMTSHGRSGLERDVFGSVADAV